MGRGIHLKEVPPKLEKYVNRINILQIVSFGSVTHYTMQAHINRVCDFFKQAVKGLNHYDIQKLSKIILDFYVLLGIYTPYNGFVIRDLDKIPNSEWCTLNNLVILLQRNVFWRIIDKKSQQFLHIMKAIRLVIKQYYYRYSHTTIDIYELRRELEHDLFNE